MSILNDKHLQALRKVVDEVMELARDFYAASDCQVSFKNDESPVTQADIAISELLERQLPTIAAFPVLSEENQPDDAQWMTWDTYWLIDPVDGTKHFINRTGDFCICIALIHRKKAVVGLIAAPVTGEVWVGQLNDGIGNPQIEKYRHGVLQPLPMVSDTETLRVTISATQVSEKMASFLSGLPSYESYRRGSALKYIDIIEGRAQLYPKLWDTCEWDSAAGQCLLECVGGSVLHCVTGQPLAYGTKKSLLNPHFIAYLHLDTHMVEGLLQRYAHLDHDTPSKSE